MALAQQLSSSLMAGTVRPLSIPIHVPFTIAGSSLPMARIALIELRNAAGQRGIGECSPFPALTGDNLEQATAVALQLLEEVRGLGTAAALQRLRDLRREIWPQSCTAYVGLEGALWDLLAREMNLPLAQLWGNGRSTRVKTDITLPLMTPDRVADFWNIYSGHDFQVIKVKVSGNLADDLAMIQALRALLPPTVKLTLDGNQGYSVEGALSLVTQLNALGCVPLFFEQPLPADDKKGQERLCAQLTIPVCADETVQTLADAGELIDRKLGQMINIKIMKSGIEESMAIIKLARQAGIALMIGGMLESEVAMGLSLHLACGTGAFQYADLDTPFFFKRRLTRQSPWLQQSAELLLPAGAGLGMELEL